MWPHPSSAVSLAIPWRQWSKRQIGNNTLAFPTALIENDLVHAAQHPFHRFEIVTTRPFLASLVAILWETGVGSDVMKPIPAPIVGGMITSTINVLILVPV
jgi:Cu/Ag efflux pump CusA